MIIASVQDNMSRGYTDFAACGIAHDKEARMHCYHEANAIAQASSSPESTKLCKESIHGVQRSSFAGLPGGHTVSQFNRAAKSVQSS